MFLTQCVIQNADSTQISSGEISKILKLEWSSVLDSQQKLSKLSKRKVSCKENLELSA